MTKNKNKYWPISLVTADECRRRLDRRVERAEKLLIEAQEELINAKQERFKLDLQTYSVMETGYGDISDPLHRWKVPYSWDLAKCEAVYWEYVDTHFRDSRLLRNFQRFINEYSVDEDFRGIIGVYVTRRSRT